MAMRGWMLAALLVLNVGSVGSLRTHHAARVRYSSKSQARQAKLKLAAESNLVELMATQRQQQTQQQDSKFNPVPVDPVDEHEYGNLVFTPPLQRKHDLDISDETSRIIQNLPPAAEGSGDGFGKGDGKGDGKGKGKGKGKGQGLEGKGPGLGDISDGKGPGKRDGKGKGKGKSHGLEHLPPLYPGEGIEGHVIPKWVKKESEDSDSDKVLLEEGNSPGKGVGSPPGEGKGAGSLPGKGAGSLPGKGTGSGSGSGSGIGPSQQHDMFASHVDSAHNALENHKAKQKAGTAPKDEEGSDDGEAEDPDASSSKDSSSKDSKSSSDTDGSDDDGDGSDEDGSDNDNEEAFIATSQEAVMSQQQLDRALAIKQAERERDEAQAVADGQQAAKLKELRNKVHRVMAEENRKQFATIL